MHSHIVGLEAKILVWAFIYILLHVWEEWRLCQDCTFAQTRLSLLWSSLKPCCWPTHLVNKIRVYHLEWPQWLSGRVIDSRPSGRGFEPHRGQYVVSLSKTHLCLLSTGSTQENPSWHNWKIVHWDIKNQIKQTIIIWRLMYPCQASR